MRIDNRALARLKAAWGGSGGGGSNPGGGSANFPIGDGNTHIWITLSEEMKSPMMGVCPNGTVTVDWGDGTDPDVLTGIGIDTVVWTPAHEYANPGDYVITLTVDGEVAFRGSQSSNDYSRLLRHMTGTSTLNRVYQTAIKKAEIGNGVIVDYDAFGYCYGLSSVIIPDGATSIGNRAFSACSNLTSITIPDSVTSFGSDVFRSCSTLTSITIPSGVTSLGGNTFYYCESVRYYDFTASTVVPTLSSTSAFKNIPSDCEIRVPAALYDEWIAATNWATYASKIVAV